MALVILFTALLLASVALCPVAARLRLPLGAVAVAVGFGAARALDALGVNTDLSWQHFSDLILGLLVPVLLFDAALNLSLEGLRDRIGPLLWLGVPGYLVTTAVLGVVLHVLPAPGSLPAWTAAALAAGLVAALDADAAGPTVGRFAPGSGLQAMLEGEALLTQVLAILLFATVLQFSEASPEPPAPAQAIVASATALGGGLAAGAMTGLIGLGLMFTFRGARPCAVIALATFVFTYALAVEFLHVSLAAALVVAGFILGAGNRRLCHEDFMQELGAFGGFLARAFLFLLVGLTLDPMLLAGHWRPALLTLGTALAARAVAVFALLPLCAHTREWTPAGRAIAFWGGQRGAMNLALALALPPALGAQPVIQAVVYALVGFSLWIQAPTLEPLVRLLHGLTPVSGGASPPASTRAD